MRGSVDDVDNVDDVNNKFVDDDIEMTMIRKCQDVELLQKILLHFEILCSWENLTVEREQN